MVAPQDEDHTEEQTMAHVVEEEAGTFDRPVHQHNGYWAGDFWTGATGEPVVW